MVDRRMGRARIKIAILDTGIFDEDQWLMGQLSDVMKYRKTQGFRDWDDLYPIKKQWCPPGETVEDTDGHGTKLAYLFLKYAPDADLYIAKVSRTTQFSDTNPVFRAIEWAVQEDVDIISLSFGSSSHLNAIEDAIKLAQRDRERLIFASASNKGLNDKRAYPARDPRVFCVHALDGNGGRGPINIRRLEGEYNYGTLGRGIKLSFKGEAEWRSGTSYATPILAAFTANLIDWLGYHAATNPKRLKKEQYEFLKGTNGIRFIFQNDMFPREEKLRYITPWHLFKSNELRWTDEDEEKGMSESKMQDIERRDGELLGAITHTMDTISENQRLAVHYQTKKYILDTIKHDFEGLPLGPSNGGEGLALYLHAFSITRSPQPAAIGRDCAMLAHILTDPKCSWVYGPQAAEGFLIFVPARLGHNAALDAIIPCLCSMYSDLLRGGTASESTFRKYVAALRALRRCIADPVYRPQSETIAASLIVEICELQLNSEDKNHNALLKGTRSLIEEAGPERFREGFERSMLDSRRGQLIIHDIADRTHCFLSQPEWRLLPGKIHGLSCSASLSQTLRNQLSEILPEIPGIVRGAHLLLNSAGPVQDTELRSIWSRATDLQHRLEQWYQKSLLPRVCGKEGQNLGDTQDSSHREYPEYVFGYLDCVACTVLAKLPDVVSAIENALEISGTDLPPSIYEAGLYTLYKEISYSAWRFIQKRSPIAAKQMRFAIDVRFFGGFTD
ncbi:subtilisin-like protein [Thozetella sp. PMI_491]|nr:subtilisin-like protein [Thozetella sp. PMI_491]